MILKRIILAGALAFVVAPALAAVVDVSAPILDIDGKPIPACAAKTPECERPMTLGDVAMTALLTPYPDEAEGTRGGVPITGQQKADRMALAIRIHDGGKVDLTAEQIALAKLLVGKAYGPLVVGRAWALLDPPAAKGDGAK